MVFTFPLASIIAQTKSFCRIFQRHIGSFHMNSMHPLVVHILKVLMEIMMCFYPSKLESLMVGGRDELPLLSNTMEKHSTLLASAAGKERIGFK